LREFPEKLAAARAERSPILSVIWDSVR
jgi:hypothetical protein